MRISNRNIIETANIDYIQLAIGKMDGNKYSISNYLQFMVDIINVNLVCNKSNTVLINFSYVSV